VWCNLREDFQRTYAHTSYRGALRKTLHVLTSPGFQAVWTYRMTRWLMLRHVPFVGALLQRFAEVWTGISLPPDAKIGPGLLIYHYGGVVVNGQSVIGAHCTMHHGATIGNRRTGGASPVLGDHVTIGAGARILGEITIGHHVEIGANAVVLHSVPDGGVAVGIPARVVKQKVSDTSQRREVSDTSQRREVSDTF